jgi:CRISPR/Cas system-associated endonuclease/helicase Cas3
MAEQLGAPPRAVYRDLDVEKAKDREILYRKRHTVSIFDGTLLDHVEEVIQSARKANSTLAVCNHVRTAQAVYDYIRPVFGVEARLLHGRFNQEDRNRIETEIVGQHLPKVLVATQVVEVSSISIKVTSSQLR